MAFSFILRKVAAEIGASDVEQNVGIKQYLTDVINQAAEEIYSKTDVIGSLRETIVRVTPNMQVTLPAFVGEIRALREKRLDRPWKLFDLRPRYHHNPWSSHWENWRKIGYSPLMAEITNAAALTYVIEEADPTVTVSTSGSTVHSARVHEDVSMLETSNAGGQNFTAIESISMNKLPERNIEIYSIEGELLSILFNDRLDAKFLWLDVSEYPSKGDCSDGRFVMEVLYKMPLQRLENPNDTFPVPGYDNIVATKAIQLLTETQEGKEDRALLMHQKVNILMREKVQDTGGALEKKLSYEPNPLYGLFRGYQGSQSRTRRSGKW